MHYYIDDYYFSLLYSEDASCCVNGEGQILESRASNVNEKINSRLDWPSVFSSLPQSSGTVLSQLIWAVMMICRGPTVSHTLFSYS